MSELLTRLGALWTPEIILWVVVASVTMAAASLIVTPMLLVRLPADYFARAAVERAPAARTPARVALMLLRNMLAAVLLVAGFLMLFLPGQGLLTILIGLFVLDVPGKQRVERRIIAQPQVRKAVDWLRRRHGRPPLEL